MKNTLSIVTPTLGMAEYLGRAIESVLSQDFASLDYLVADGGSSDGTVDLLRGFEGRLRWRSENDGGAAAALQRAFREAPGSILGWLNADDILLPGALAQAAQAFERYPDAVAVFGGASWVDQNLRLIRPYPVVADAARRLSEQCLICQPACFFRADAYHACGGIDPTLHSAFDYDLWIRLARLGPMVYIPGEWAWSRMHPGNKSLGQRQQAFEEGAQVLRRHFDYVPFSWIYARRVHRIDGRDQFFEPLQPSLRAYFGCLPEGLATNHRHPLRYLQDWASQFGWRAAGRMLGRTRSEVKGRT
ncbi:glycosyltransferase family 2 protein [uncultured Paludibaculum sp.]|uniref:glycosyltransferase family 2 protein n=1 Tax=uncultured Paludibaculum sp. TaxID=1765020 RepID=UPI002AAAB5BA|nr:glycosyltransferase family 2 protein [uncultured Paludibaculum sp.]